MQMPSLGSPDWPHAPGYQLIQNLSPFLSPTTYPKGKKLPLRDKENGLCYIVLEGITTMHRVSDGLMLSVLESPSVCGVGHFMLRNNTAFLKTYTPCRIAVLSSTAFEELIVRENLWQPLSLHLISVINKLFAATTSLTYTNAYGMVRAQLLQLSEEPEIVRASFTAANYIKNKTHLSRSGIMRILGQLREGGFIEIDRGFLIRINKLPLGY